MRSNPLRATLLTFSLLASVQHVLAQELSAINVGELGRIQGETILLKAQAERAEAAQKIPGSGRSTERPESDSAPSAAPPAAPSNVTNEYQADLPVIRMIYGAGGPLKAALQFGTGIEVEAVAGRALPDGFRTIQVTLDGVTLERNGRRYPIGFASQQRSTR